MAIKSSKNKSIPIYQRIWKEGKYIDFWNIPHFLAGMLLAIILIHLNFSFYFALILTIILKISWEMYERKKVIKETIENQFFDVVTGVLGFLALHLFYTQYFNLVLAQVFIFVIWIGLTVWGFIAMKKLGSLIFHKKGSKTQI